MRFLGLSLALLITLGAVVAVEKNYEGYQLIQVVPQTDHQLHFLRHVMTNNIGADFWAEPRQKGSPVDILLSPHHFTNITSHLKRLRLGYTIENSNVQSSIIMERLAISARKEEATKLGLAFDLDNFNTLIEIEDWMDDLVNDCRSGLTCEVYIIGRSVDGNPIKVFKISKEGANRKAYYFDGTTHAREWLGTATVLKLLNQLVYGKDSNAQYLTDTYDFYFIPVVNPDGYEFSWTNERLWRKNRSLQNFGCYGVDLNRNFGTYSWGKEGTSNNPCSDIFHGPDPNSEPETLAVANELVRLGPSLKALVSIHAYAYMWIFPWGNTVNYAGKTCQRSDDHDEVMRVANAAADATQNTYKTDKWERGNACEVIYPTTGSTDDFGKDKAQVKYNYCIEVRGNSFVAMPSMIDLSFNEVYNGVIAMNKAIEAA